MLTTARSTHAKQVKVNTTVTETGHKTATFA